MNYDSPHLSGISMYVLEKMTGWMGLFVSLCLGLSAQPAGQALRCGLTQFRRLHRGSWGKPGAGPTNFPLETEGSSLQLVPPWEPGT